MGAPDSFSERISSYLLGVERIYRGELGLAYTSPLDAPIKFGTRGHAANSGRMVGQPECAGINRHVVGDERALQERKQRIHPGLESCRRYREVALEA
jgi:succinylarginine dihydrolase